MGASTEPAKGDRATDDRATDDRATDDAQEPPMPWFGVFILISCNLVEPIVMAMLFPIAPYMVADWVAADEVGTWAGLLTSAYNAASIPAAIFWGRLSDRMGRRPIMLILLCGAAGVLRSNSPTPNHPSMPRLPSKRLVRVSLSINGALWPGAEPRARHDGSMPRRPLQRHRWLRDGRHP